MTIILPDELTELKALPQWVAFKLIMNEQKGKPDKVPYDPKTGGRAKANDPATWATYDEAVAFADRRGYFNDRTGGIGFEFANGIAGVDLDGVILPDGTLKPYAREIVERMNSYTEISPSGKGLHILFRMTGSMSDIGPRRRNDELGVEAYSEGRYFTITGQVYGDVKPIAERTGEMRVVYEKYIVKPEKAEAAKSNQSLPPTVETQPPKTPQGERVPSEELSDGELWERMIASENGRDIQALYNGDISGYTRTHQDGNTYPDHSAADMAMCLYLAYWTGNDAYRMDSMFRQTRLYRDKWERTDYRERTISEAIRLMPTYVPAVRDTVRVQATAREKGTASPVGVSSAGVRESVSTEGSRQGEVMRPDSWTPPMNGYDYVDSGTFQAELARFQKYPDIHTDFQNFDEAQGGLSPGLYVLGATPSLGKTTLLVQMADNIAKSGNAVLYFSLEQSRLELTTKSISRLTAQHGIKNAVSAINIRRGQYTSDAQREAVQKAIADYQEFSANISIVELNLNETITTIIDTVSRYINYMPVRPVVMVDYLQIVKPPKDEKRTTKEGVDYVVGALKQLQVDNNLVVMVISSFNRTNYLTPVDYESFKETGGIEYTADVLLGLQPQIMTDDLFNNEKKVKERREAVDKALSAIPRRIMLKNLKNRFGRKGYACGFTYDPRFDFFVPDDSFKGECQ